MTTFDSGRQPWLRRQGLLRNVVRQHVVTRQLQVHLPAEPASVLDVGAGQGTQAIALAQAGHDVLGVEPDETMRAAFAAAAATQPPDVRARLQVVDGRLGALAEAIGERRFDVVCCHGVLMYLPSSREAVVELSDLVAPGGIVSLLARNADAMAMRPALREQWADALDLMDAAADEVPRYVNELGVSARADRLEELASYVAGRRMHVEAWYGVRVMTDGVPSDRPVPRDPDELAALLAVEERAGRTDPYRRLGTLLHLVGRRAAVPSGT
ncbi:class I SAM-dependent methyltransferase [Angustibacter aerolatus]